MNATVKESVNQKFRTSSCVVKFQDEGRASSHRALRVVYVHVGILVVLIHACPRPTASSTHSTLFSLFPRCETHTASPRCGFCARAHTEASRGFCYSLVCGVFSWRQSKCRRGRGLLANELSPRLSASPFCSNCEANCPCLNPTRSSGRRFRQH